MNNHVCSAKNVADLLACKQCGINQICCKECFTSKHKGENGYHPSTRLTDSDVFRNFLKLVHVEWLVGQKVLKSLGEFKIPDQNVTVYMVNAAFYGSQFYRQFFAQQNSAQQYMILKSLYSNTAVTFQTLSGLQKILNQAKSLQIISKHISKLTQLTQQQKLMNSHLDFYTGADIYYLQQFVSHEQHIFWQFVEIVKKEEKQFTIYKYLEWREKTCNKEKSQVYYSKEFTAFMVEFYRKQAADKGMYTLNDFVLNYWQYFHTSVQLNPTLKTYLDSQVSFYRQYEKLMTENSLTITYLGFKIWKLSNGVSKQLPFLKNHYFLFAFSQGYIKMLIERTYSFNTQQQKQQHLKQTWMDFLTYIKDYSLLMQQKKSQLSLQSYKDYYIYRRRMQPFHTRIKASKENIYDKQVAVKFFNHYFESPLQLKPKNYKEFFDKIQAQKKQREEQFQKRTEELKAELQSEEKQTFYEFVFLNFIAYCQEQEIAIKKQTYCMFKKNVMDNMDEQYIQETEEKFKRGDFNEVYEDEQENPKQQAKEEGEKTTIGQTGAKITVGMDQYEESILENKIHQDQESDNQGEQTVCPCCNGDDGNCQNPECQLMGWCATCSV